MFVLLSTVAYLACGLLISFGFAVLIDYAILENLKPRSTFGRMIPGVLLATPLLVSLDAASKAVSFMSPFKGRLYEAFVFLGFVGLLFTASLQSFDPADRFAFRTRLQVRASDGS